MGMGDRRTTEINLFPSNIRKHRSQNTMNEKWMIVKDYFT